MAGYVDQRNAYVLSSLGHVLVELTDSNKEQLLSAGYRTFRRYSAGALSICARLAQLSPEVANLFKPKEEALSRLSLRMVLDNSRNTPFAAAPVSSFIAVSYAWHYSDWQLPAAASPIAPGWEISKPMADAIMACRQSDSEGVWIDKLCINQDDELDRAINVGAMDVIYRSARRLIILLEDVQLGGDEAFAALLYEQWYQEMCDAVMKKGLEGSEKSEFMFNLMFEKDSDFDRECCCQSCHDKSFHSISFARRVAARRGLTVKILKARWFSRAWCAHESRIRPHDMLNNPLMLCFGPDGTVLSFEFRFIYWLSSYITDASAAAEKQLHTALEAPQGDPFLGPRSSSNDNHIGQIGISAAIHAGDDYMPDHEGFVRRTKIIIDQNHSELTQLQYRMIWMHTEPDETCSSLRRLLNILPHKCTFAADLISIALNTSRLPLVFTGKIDTAKEAIQIFIVLVVASNDVAPMLASRGSYRLSDDVTSWPPSATQGMLPDALRLPDPSVISTMTRDYIELDLLVFRTIPVEPFSSAVTQARALIHEANLMVFAHKYAAAFSSDVKRYLRISGLPDETVRWDTPITIDEFIETWLAHGIDCGFAWMARFPETMRQATEKGFLYGTIHNAPEDKLNSVGRALFALTALNTNDRYESIEPDIALASGAQKMAHFLRTILDPRLRFFTAEPRRLALNRDDYAIMSRTTTVGYTAVPLALAHAPAQYKRAWVIEPFDSVAEQHCLEKVEDYPDPAQIRTEPGKSLDGVLTPAFGNQRRPRNEAGIWRSRSRSEIFGCQSFEPIISHLAGRDIDNNGKIMLLRKQKVYGARDNDWAAVFEASKRLGGFHASELDRHENARA